MIKAALRFLPRLNNLAFSLLACAIGGCATVPPAPIAKAESALCLPAAPCATPLPVKVVIVTMFEIGDDEGDRPGEFQFWKERRPFTQRIAFPQGHHDLFYDPKNQVLAIVTGMGTAKSAAAIMALGLDMRFDLRKSYWLVAGIAGGDPNDTSVGSAAWAHYIVDGDLAHEIDPREAPKNWSTGYFALDTKFPYDPKKAPLKGEMFEANVRLRDWAYELTKDIKPPDLPELATERQKFKGYPNAQRPPFIQKGDTIQSMTFWHGKLLNDWANRWVSYWSDGKGEFVTSAMEDTGTMQSLTYLGKVGRVDPERAMVLRSVSNFTMQPPSMTAAGHLLDERGHYSGMRASLEALYMAGSKVVDELTTHWDKYEATIPGS
jgi:purine nucleoside permease